MAKTPIVCKGSYNHGTACGLCVRCEHELSHIKKEKRVKVSETDLNHWEFAAQDPELISIIQLARIGLATEQHSVAIEDALSYVMARLPIAHISRYERALDAFARIKNGR